MPGDLLIDDDSFVEMSKQGSCIKGPFTICKYFCLIEAYQVHMIQQWFLTTVIFYLVPQKLQCKDRNMYIVV